MRTQWPGLDMRELEKGRIGVYGHEKINPDRDEQVAIGSLIGAIVGGIVWYNVDPLQAKVLAVVLTLESAVECIVNLYGQRENVSMEIDMNQGRVQMNYSKRGPRHVSRRFDAIREISTRENCLSIDFLVGDGEKREAFTYYVSNIRV